MLLPLEVVVGPTITITITAAAAEELKFPVAKENQHALILVAEAVIFELPPLHLALFIGAEVEPFEALALQLQGPTLVPHSLLL